MAVNTGNVWAKLGWRTLLVATLLLGSAWIWVNRVPGSVAAGRAGLPPAPALGHPAPGFTLATLDGKKLELAQLRGKPVVLNFWATWCPPCRGEMPELERAAWQQDGRVVVLGVDQEEPANVVEDFVAQQGITFPIPLDGDGNVSRAYGVRALPTTFFIDRNGVIRQISIGPLTEATLAQLLQSIYP